MNFIHPEQLLANLPTVLRALCDYFAFGPATPLNAAYRLASVIDAVETHRHYPFQQCIGTKPSVFNNSRMDLTRLRRGVAWAARLPVKSDKAGRLRLI